MANINKILELAKKRGVKLTFLNELIGGYRGKITEWKAGKSTPTKRELIKIAKYFNVPVEMLMYENYDVTSTENAYVEDESEKTSYITIVGSNGTQKKIIVPDEKIERFKKLIEAGMPELLDDEYDDL